MKTKNKDKDFKRCKRCGVHYWIDKDEEYCPICKVSIKM